MYGRVLVAQPGRRDVVQLALGQHGGAHRSRDDRREHDADHRDHGESRRTQRDERQQADDHDRHRQERVDHPAQPVVDRPVEVAGHQAERGAEHGPDQRGERRNDQDVARPHDHAREHVAPELVGPEPMGARRPFELAEQLQRVRILGTTDEPKSAQSTQKPTMTAPTRNVLERTSARRRSRRATLAALGPSGDRSVVAAPSTTLIAPPTAGCAGSAPRSRCRRSAWPPGRSCRSPGRRCRATGSPSAGPRGTAAARSPGS